MAEDFCSKFEIQKSLGQGMFPCMFKVVSLEDRQTYALKVIRDAAGEDDHVKQVYIMMALNHPNVVRVFEAIQSSPTAGPRVRTGIVLEYCGGGDLNQFIADRKDQPFSWNRLYTWMKQLASAVAYIHEKLIIHRNLKPCNVLLDDSGCLKLGKFFTSRMLTSAFAQTVVGSPMFMAPEALYGQYDFKADVYSLGCIFLCMATLSRLPKKKNGQFLDLPPVSVYGKEVNELIESCIRADSEDRPEAGEVLQALEVLEYDGTKDLESTELRKEGEEHGDDEDKENDVSNEDNGTKDLESNELRKEGEEHVEDDENEEEQKRERKIREDNATEKKDEDSEEELKKPKEILRDIGEDLRNREKQSDERNQGEEKVIRMFEQGWEKPKDVKEIRYQRIKMSGGSQDEGKTGREEEFEERNEGREKVVKDFREETDKLTEGDKLRNENSADSEMPNFPPPPSILQEPDENNSSSPAITPKVLEVTYKKREPSQPVALLIEPASRAACQIPERQSKFSSLKEKFEAMSRK